MPVEIRSSGAGRADPVAVIGSTTMPRSVITNGYSFVPCSDPRYFATRSRRVASSSWIRSSSSTTQSETYSSMPYLVSSPDRPRSLVMIAVRPRSLSQRTSRFSSARTVDSLSSAANNTSTVSSTTRFAPIVSTALPSLMNRPSRSNPPATTAPASIRNTSTANSPRRSSSGRSNPSEAMSVANSSAASSKDSRTPGSPNFRAPQTRNSSPNTVLPDPAPPVTSVARPRGRPPRVISSKTPIPVGAFTNPAAPACCAASDPAPVASFIPDQPQIHRIFASRYHPAGTRSSPRGGGGPRTLNVAQFLFAELTGRRPGHLEDEVDRLGCLELRDLLLDVGDQILLVGVLAGGQHHERLRPLAPPLVGDGDHGDVGDRRMGHQRVLH